MRVKPTPAQLFVYGLAVTVLVFVAGCKRALVLLAAINGVPGFLVGGRRYPLLVALFLLGVVGTFINALAVANTGAPVLAVGPLTVREGAVEATLMITLRFAALGGVSLLYATMITPREALRSMERELGLPKGVAFAFALSLRLLGIAQRDLREILAVRRIRGARRIPVTPGDYQSLMMPLLSIMLERARWIGIAAELRGFRLRPGRRGPSLVVTVGLVVLAVLLAVQVLGVALLCGS